MPIYNPEILKAKSSGRKKEFKAIAQKIWKLKGREADKIIRQYHNDEFTTINCLECANCCKTLGPRLTHSDIERMSGYIKLPVKDFCDNYISVDNDGDYIFNISPCPFLQSDNYCSIYDARPRACRTYPHTDRNNIRGIIMICLKNTETCPVVYNIFEKLARHRLK